MTSVTPPFTPTINIGSRIAPPDVSGNHNAAAPAHLAVVDAMLAEAASALAAEQSGKDSDAKATAHAGLRPPQRSPLQGGEITRLLDDSELIQVPMPASLHAVFANAAKLADQAFALAGAAAVGKLAGGAAAALRAQMDAFVDAHSGGRIAGLRTDTRGLQGLRENAQAQQATELTSKVDTLLALDGPERDEQTRSDAMFALMVLLMTLLMEMAEQDRNQGAAALQKSEDFVKVMGQKLVDSAEKHRTGAIIAFATTATIAVAGLAASGFAAAKNVKSIASNERGAVVHQQKAAKLDFDAAQGTARSPGGASMNQSQQSVLQANSHRTAAALQSAKHNMNLTQNQLLTQGGQSAGQISYSAGNIAQAELDVQAAEETRISENFRKAAEVSKSTADNQSQRSTEESRLVADIRQSLSAILDEQANTANTFTGNLSA